MLSMNAYPKEYVDACRARAGRQVAAYRSLATAARKAGADAAVDAFEPVFFNTMVLALDAFFVHRSRTLERKDGNPLNEIRVLCSSMLQHDDVMTADRGIKLVPERSVLRIPYGETITVTDEGFAALSTAFFDEIERTFVA